MAPTSLSSRERGSLSLPCLERVLGQCQQASEALPPSLHPRCEGLDIVQAEAEVRRALEATYGQMRAAKAALADAEALRRAQADAGPRSCEAAEVVMAMPPECIEFSRGMTCDEGDDQFREDVEEHRRREWCTSKDGRHVQAQTVSVEMIKRGTDISSEETTATSPSGATARSRSEATATLVSEPSSIRGCDTSGGEDEDETDAQASLLSYHHPDTHRQRTLQAPAQFSWPRYAPAAPRLNSMTSLAPFVAPKRRTHGEVSPGVPHAAILRRDRSPDAARSPGRSPFRLRAQSRGPSPPPLRQAPARSGRPLGVGAFALGSIMAENRAPSPSAPLRPRRTQGNSVGAPPGNSASQAACITTPPTAKVAPSLASQAYTPSDKSRAPARNARAGPMPSSRSAAFTSTYASENKAVVQQPPSRQDRQLQENKATSFVQQPPSRQDRQPLAELCIQAHPAVPAIEPGPPRKTKGEQRWPQRPPQIESHSYAPPPGQPNSFVPPMRSVASYVPAPVAVVSYMPPPTATVTAAVLPYSSSPVRESGVPTSPTNAPMTPVYGSLAGNGRSSSLHALPTSWGVPGQALFAA